MIARTERLVCTKKKGCTMNTRNVTDVKRTRQNGGMRGQLLPALLVLACSSFVLTGLASAADAQGGRGRMGGQTQMMRGLGLEVLGMADELKLTEQQVTQLKNIRKSVPAKIMPKSQALMEARIDYRDLMADTNADTKAIRAAHKRVLDAQSQLKSATFDLRLEVRDVLTPEQRAQLKKQVRQRVRSRADRPRRLQRERLNRHGRLHSEGMGFGPMGAPFGPMDESTGLLDDEADFGFFGPAAPHWSDDEPFAPQGDPEEAPEGERL
jgi:protein CpxP